MSDLDRAIRFLLAMAMGAAWFSGAVSGWLGTVLAIMAMVLLVTSLAGWCPLYVPFRWSTRKHAHGHPV
ncbi:MAG: DUF2892 domain-containing protein [Gemmatimonadetes bacterium]|nr:DUF2892 domain-containing protein [Gemmatimonadota bacterium]